MYTTVQYFRVNNFFLFNVYLLNTHINFIKSDSKDIYNATKYLYFK